MANLQGERSDEETCEEGLEKGWDESKVKANTSGIGGPWWPTFELRGVRRRERRGLGEKDGLMSLK